MKRILCVLMTIAMLMAVSSASAQAEGFSLPWEFYQKVHAPGNAVRAVFRMSVDGSAEWVNALRPFSGVTFTYRGETIQGTYQHELSLDLNGEAAGTSILYGDTQQAWFRTDYLMDTLLTMPLDGSLGLSLQRLFSGQEDTNPIFWTALLGIALPDDDFSSALEPLRQSIDFWLESCQGEMTTAQEDGSTRIVIRYEITPMQIKSEMKTLLRMALQSEEILKHLQNAMSNDQIAVYLQPELLWYYDAIIDGLRLEDTLYITRTLSTLGDEISLQLEMPMSSMGQWTHFSATFASDTSAAIALASESRNIALDFSEYKNSSSGGVWRGTYRSMPVEGQNLEVDFDIVSVHTVSVTDDQDHDITSWTVNLHRAENADEDAAPFESTSMRIRAHFSAPQQTSSTQQETRQPTLFLEAEGTIGEGQFTLVGRMAPRSPWEMDILDKEGGSDITTLSIEERQELWQDIIENARVKLQRNHPEQTDDEAVEPTVEEDAAVTEDTATATDLEQVPVEAESETVPEESTDASQNETADNDGGD